MNQINIPYKLKILNSNNEIAVELTNFIEEEGFTKIALITSKTPNHLLTNSLELALFNHVDKLKTFQVVNPSISFVNQLPIKEFDLVVGVGGGKVIDTAKYAAFVNGIPCISIPTAISNDGICSPIAVLKEKENKYKSLGAEIPIALLVPMHLIEKSSEDSLMSGIGDLLTNLSAIEDWDLASKENDEYIDDYSVMISRNAALTVFLEIENCILLRKTKEQFLKQNLKTIIESLALSGIAMEIAGTSRPASGAEHLISHSFDELFGGLKPHGIQVAFGMYIVTFIRAKLGMISKNTFEELRAVLRFLGLPVSLSQMGLTKEQLIEAIIHAPKSRPDRYTILNKISLDEKSLDDTLTELFSVGTSVLV